MRLLRKTQPQGVLMISIKLSRLEGIKAEKIKIDCGDHRITLLVLSPEEKTEDVPGVLWIHGGGYVTGMKEMAYMSRAYDLVKRHKVIVVSPGYRLAPWHPYPAAIDDCYSALLWMKDNVKRLQIRDDQLMVGGESAGGGLCAALCMMARDRRSVNIAYQMPLYPMLDCFDTESSKDNHGRFWNTRKNHLGWRCYLGKGYQDVSPYASPSRQTDYADLPPCYTFIGHGEPFYDETLKYVKDLREAGVEAYADVYHTDIHSFDMLYPKMDISVEAIGNFNEHFAYAVERYRAPQS